MTVYVSGLPYTDFNTDLLSTRKTPSATRHYWPAQVPAPAFETTGRGLLLNCPSDSTTSSRWFNWSNHQKFQHKRMVMMG